MTDVGPAFRALADPTRRRIMELVAEGSMSAGEIAAHFNTTRPAVSQHLTVLRQAGLIHEHRVGSRRLYQAQPEVVGKVIEYLQGFWAPRLSELKRQAERREKHRRGGS
ncbi:MAG TPA: metalloregulator ArsR/SmtB family transcription factor [Acidimicrobiia bacterium]|nr:metalloregulator ArsR/SmtB family transcription factor [Acidimicrobiia bacterium]